MSEFNPMFDFKIRGLKMAYNNNDKNHKYIRVSEFLLSYDEATALRDWLNQALKKTK